MEGVGRQVFIALGIPVFALLVLTFYFKTEILEYLRFQMSADVRIEETEQERHRREGHVADTVCSICLAEPKEHEVSSTCGHSFCSDCILSLYQHNNDQIKCPLCRQGISLLFRLFQPTPDTAVIEQRLRDYNRIFDDNRPLYRRIIELPYTFKRVWRSFFSLQFLVFFLRTLQITRWLLVIIVYVLMPFDLIPERFLGIIGYIDDLLFILLVFTFLLTVAAVQYYRQQNS